MKRYHRILYLIVAFLLGAGLMCGVAMLQKNANGQAINLEGLFFPFLIGGATGLIIGFLQIRLQETVKEIQNRETNLQALVNERTLELEKATNTMQRLTQLDGLTGVANRGFFDERIVQEWRRCSRTGFPVAVILCQLYGYPDLKASLGSEQAGEYLRKVAGVITSHLKRSGDFIARFHEDTFALILPNTPIEGACFLAERIRDKVSMLRLPNGQADRFLTVSMGASAGGYDPSVTHQDLIDAASHALQAARQKGGGHLETAPLTVSIPSE